MDELLLEILHIEQKDYFKLCSGKIKMVSSDEYIHEKQKILNNYKSQYTRKINYNIRTYYNSDKLISESNKISLNIWDFSINILNKPRRLARIVLKDEKNGKRMYIGKYRNSELPIGYIEENIVYIDKSIKMGISKAMYKYNLKLNKEEKEDEMQNCRLYLLNKGNNLDKYNHKIIKSNKYRKFHSKVFYYKSYYFELNSLKNIQRNLEYKENLFYKNASTVNEYNYQSDVDLIENMNYSDIEKRILLGLIKNGYNEENIKELAIKENIKELKIKKIITNLKAK